nr:hypothetical protein [Tanacetum cinerariifolium]
MEDHDISSAIPCFFIHVLYAISCLYIRSLSVMLSRISFYVLIRQSFMLDFTHVMLIGESMCFSDFPDCFRPFKTLCFFNYALMLRQDYDITSSLRRGALQFSFEVDAAEDFKDIL